jgi:uncharacterized protein with HEPN domain
LRLDSHYLEDIRSAAEQIGSFISRMKLKDFMADAKTRSAVERQLITMGEAASRISAQFKAAHSDVPWARLVQLRNFYIHGYDRLSSEQVWGTAKKLVPRVARLVAGLLPPDGDDL